MKNLYIFRHGKSSWDYPELSDAERPLLKKGEKRTKTAAEHLNSRIKKPDLFISSHAVRAYETAKIVAKVFGYPVSEIVIDRKIYASGVETLFNVIYSLNNKVDSVILFGHNPEFTLFANEFLHQPVDWIPTSGIAGISFDCENWTEINLAKKMDQFVVFPKSL